MSGSMSHVSIVIVAHNQLKYSGICIESVLKRTHYPFRLVLVDNGSTDGTEDYFRSIESAVVIRNDTNAGFPAGANTGMRSADGAYVVLLNNDTIVTDGWLTRLVEAAESDETIGLVGPLTNHSKGAQLIGKRDFRDAQELEEYARRLATDNAGQRQLTDCLTGFCLLIKREVIEQIGYLDERFGIGNFEDDDYCLRARQAGYKLVIAMDCFVYHFGERTFLELGIEGDRWINLLSENRELFAKKWQGTLERSEKHVTLSSRLVEEGRNLLETGNAVAALRKFVEAFAEDPVNGSALLGSGLALRLLGKKEQAYENLKRALRINPGLQEAHRHLRELAAELDHETDVAAFLVEIKEGNSS
jgi:GT2 family glycosyltransferase